MLTKIRQQIFLLITTGHNLSSYATEDAKTYNIHINTNVFASAIFVTQFVRIKQVFCKENCSVNISRITEFVACPELTE